MSSTVLRRGGPSDGASLFDVGVSLIREECEKAGIPEPVYEVDTDGIRIIFKSGPWSDNGEDTTEQSVTDELKPLEMEIYKMIAEGRYTTAREMAVSLGTSSRTVERSVVKLKKMGLVRRAGSKKNGKLELDRPLNEP